jgi:tetratricopeptide (TPR) repeat protein
LHFRLACCALALLALGGCRMWSQTQNAGGVAQYRQGQYPQAIATFQEALKIDPNNADAYYNLAASYHQAAKQSGDQNTYLHAEQLYNRCLDIEANHIECHRALAVLLVETNRQDKAFTLMKNWAIASPQVGAARVELARLYEEFGDKQTAATYLSQALQINPQDARALAALGKMREQQGDTQQALANYQRAYQLNPLQPGVAERLAALSPRPATPAAPATVPVTPTTPPATRFASPPVSNPRY